MQTRTTRAELFQNGGETELCELLILRKKERKKKRRNEHVVERSLRNKLVLKIGGYLGVHSVNKELCLRSLEMSLRQQG